MLEVYEISRVVLHNFEDVPFSEDYGSCPVEALRAAHTHRGQC